MTRRIKFHPAARADLREALRWYQSRDRVLAAQFVDELARGLQQIAQTPQRWPLWEYGARRLLLHRFPYRIVYREAADDVQVYAISHTSRHPGHWRDRRTT